MLKLNNFQFDSQNYQQKSGVAMGTKMGPTIANIFLGYLEEKAAVQYNGTQPELYLRYIDDIFGITTMSTEDLLKWINFTQNFHNAIKYTFETSTTEATFLDIKFFNKDNKITTSIYYKPTDSHNYLRFESFHPYNIKKSFLKLNRSATAGCLH